MRVLVIGSSGFVGSSVLESFDDAHDAWGASRKKSIKNNEVYIDLLVRKTISGALSKIRPDVVINCAGVVDNSEVANQNPVFTSNLLKEILESKLDVKRIIILGSAAEYGVVDASNIPVSESAPLNANSGYGLSKVQETSLALEFGNKHGLPVVVARIFNPIGNGMHQRFIIPRIIEQIREIKNGIRESIEISRLDSKRDYVNVNDVALAIKTIVEGSPKETVYNIGSGTSTSNEELVWEVVKRSNLESIPSIRETSNEPESLVAIRADISRMKSEFNWEPKYNFKDTVKEIIHGTN